MPDPGAPMGMWDDTWRPLAGLFSVGTVLVAAILLGWYAGSSFDEAWSTKPWGMVVGVAIGTAAGFAQLFRVVKKSLK